MIINILYIILAIGYVFVALFIAYTMYAFIKGAPFVPTAKGNVGKMIRIAKLTKYDTLLDLGSGDGRILKRAAKFVKKAIGIEINPLLYWWSKLLLSKYDNIEIYRNDLWKTDLSSVDVLTLFFIAGKMDALQKKIKREMQPGSRVVSYGFKFPNWNYVTNDDKVYLYIV